MRAFTDSRRSSAGGRQPALLARRLRWLGLCLLVAGCQQQPAATSREPASLPAEAAAVPVTDAGRGEVELVEATATPMTLDEDLRIVDFEVAYRFTAGSPQKYYLAEIAFPGTECWGVKPFIPNELKPEGVFRTKIEVGDAPVQEFRMTLSEADSPDRGFHRISNELTGVIEDPPQEAQPGTQAESP